MIKALVTTLVAFTCLSTPVFADTHTIEDEFDGCEHGKDYPLTNGQFFICEEYQYFYEYSPRVIAGEKKVNPPSIIY